MHIQANLINDHHPQLYHSALHVASSSPSMANTPRMTPLPTTRTPHTTAHSRESSHPPKTPSVS
ncbi:hypothetical protein CC80DRAFT_496886 [Byssothecium circinans]|uniref:Uncharacterized protein n=1 Tax=Byssothecium circinans TaxID=147558 RepID=A0A6A5THH0_9PLEO|nr:hypothetical protein CC80DRAFT_496886 [Byssothecium circinans]